MLSLMAFMMISCAKSTVLSDYCLITKPSQLNIEGLRVYDCLCSDKPVNPKCKGN